MVRILLLENNSSDFEQVKASLAASPVEHSLDQVTAYADFLHELSYHPPHLVLASNQLIAIDDSSVLAQIRHRYPAVPVIIIAGNPDIAEAVDAMRQGASDYIPKARLTELLPAAIHALCDGEGLRPGHRQLAPKAPTAGTQPYSMLQSRLSRQAIVAALMRQALAGMEIGLLFKNAVSQISRVFDVEYCEVFELVSYHAGFVLRAAQGWPAEAIDQTTLGVEADSQSGLTLLSNQPIVIQDISCDPRLTPSKLIYPTRVSSLVSVLISGAGRQPFGLVSVASHEADRFTQEDALFLQSIANVLAIATERKRSEQSLRAHASELACMTTVLAKTNDELAERNRELNEFAYVASHDLKAPLRAIANLSEWIEEELQEHMGPKTAYEMNLLRKRVYRIESLLNGLLQYSRVGRLNVEPELVSTAAILRDVVDLLDPPIDFAIVIGGNMPSFSARRLLLQQTFSNLMGNALKHHHGSQGLIEVAVQDCGKFYEFSVTDDGPGIAPEYHGKIFTIFQVLEPRDKTENTGVGLSIAKKIVESEGGTITVESGLGSGATFRFTWPKS